MGSFETEETRSSKKQTNKKRREDNRGKRWRKGGKESRLHFEPLMGKGKKQRWRVRRGRKEERHSRKIIKKQKKVSRSCLAKREEGGSLCSQPIGSAWFAGCGSSKKKKNGRKKTELLCLAFFCCWLPLPLSAIATHSFSTPYHTQRTSFFFWLFRSFPHHWFSKEQKKKKLHRRHYHNHYFSFIRLCVPVNLSLSFSFSVARLVCLPSPLTKSTVFCFASCPPPLSLVLSLQLFKSYSYSPSANSTRRALIVNHIILDTY